MSQLLKQKESEDVLKQKIILFVTQTQTGCGKSSCFNHYCRNNPDRPAISKKEAVKIAIDLVKSDQLRSCSQDGPIQSFSSGDMLKLVNHNQLDKLKLDYSNALARVDILGTSYSKSESETGLLDFEAIDKVSKFVYEMENEPRQEFFKNFNTYMVD